MRFTAGVTSNAQVEVIYTDFEKAFDRVDHRILLFKLHQFGVRGALWKLIHSYLTGRQQTVRVGAAISDFIDIPSEFHKALF